MSKKNLDRFDIVKRLLRQELNGSQASRLLGLSVRQVRRLKAGVRARGAKAFAHGLTGKVSNHRIPEKERLKIVGLLQTKYADFGPTLAAEKLREVHHIIRDPETIRRIMIGTSLWKPRDSRKKSAHRAWRQRRAAFGEMLQFDGSYHDWFEGRNGSAEACLLAAIDDATGRITQAEFAAHEGVFPVFGFWKSYIETRGKPRSIYLDKFSTYKMNVLYLKDNPDLKTQFGRAMEDLGIEPIFANSPQAKGRVERLFDTLQDRLVKELRLANISTWEDGNRFLATTFLPAFNRKFAVAPASDADLHRPLTAHERTALPAILSRQEHRTIQNDFTFSHNARWYQLGPDQPCTVRQKEVVTVEEWLDGSVHIRLRGKELNHIILPARPRKLPWMDEPRIIAKTAPRIPAPDHPLRLYKHADAQQAMLAKLRTRTFLQRPN